MMVDQASSSAAVLDRDDRFHAGANDPLARSLNVLLSDLFALYLKTKNFHWHVSGPHFRAYHLMFDEQAQQILATTDAVAERVRRMGAATLHSVAEIGRLQRISDNEELAVAPAAMLAELLSDNKKLVAEFRRTKEIADDVRDNAASGLIDQWTDEAEQRAWFLYEAGR